MYIIGDANSNYDDNHDDEIMNQLRWGGELPHLDEHAGIWFGTITGVNWALS